MAFSTAAATLVLSSLAATSVLRSWAATLELESLATTLEFGIWELETARHEASAPQARSEHRRQELAELTFSKPASGAAVGKPPGTKPLAEREGFQIGLPEIEWLYKPSLQVEKLYG